MEILKEITEEAYVISDTHFFHKSICDFEPSRNIYKELGYKSHEEFLIDMWNSTVSDDDIVIHLGDFSFEKEPILKNLRGRKILIKGNHDHLPSYYYDSIFELVIKGGNVLGIHDNFFLDLVTRHKYANGLILPINNTYILFTHIPILPATSYDIRYYDAMEDLYNIFHEYDCTYNIHGHIHSKCEYKLPNFINACVEVIGFKPTKIKTLIERSNNEIQSYPHKP